MKIKLHVIFLSVALLSLLFTIFTHLEKYTTPFDFAEMSAIYSTSQYVLGPKATTAIGDDGLFAMAGYYYLLQGGNPAQIDFENPPLGKYLIGFSILLFGNERVISIIYAALFLVVTYLLGIKIFRNSTIAAGAVMLLSFGPLLQTHIISNLLDLPQALYILSALYFFILGLEKTNRYFALSSFFLGLAVANKFFPGVIFFFSVFFIWLSRSDRKRLFPWLLSLGLIPLIYIASYTMFFKYNPSLIEFLKFHKWLLNWRLGNPRVAGNIFLTLFIGHYRDWWGANSWIKFNEWTLVTPLIAGGGLTSIFFVPFRKYPYFIYTYSICIIFLLYVALGTTGIAKYIYPVNSLWALFTVFLMFKLGQRILIYLTNRDR